MYLLYNKKNWRLFIKIKNTKYFMHFQLTEGNWYYVKYLFIWKNINVLKVYVNNPETILKIRDRVEDKGNSKILVQILMNGEDKYQTELKLGNNFI